MIGDHTGRGYRLPVRCHGECFVERYIQNGRDGVGGVFIYWLPLYGLVDGGPADTGLAGEGGQGAALGTDPGPKVQLADGGDAVPDAALLEVAVKAVDMSCAEITEPDVAHGLVDPNQVLGVGADGLGLQVELGVLGHVLGREVSEADIGVGGGPGLDLLLEQHGPPLQLLFDLPLCHAWFRNPGHVLPDALAGIVIALGNGDLIALPLFLNGRHAPFACQYCPVVAE